MAAPAVQGQVSGSRIWLKMLEHSDTALAVGVVAVLAVLVIPLPPVILDILLTVNISIGLIILMVVLSCGEPLDFSTFLPEWLAVVPRWRDYYYAHDQRPHYAYMKNVLKALQWLRGPNRWILKSPVDRGEA